MKQFRAIFSISSILVIRSWNAKKDHFSILAVFQNVWYFHKFWLQIWIQNAKNTLWKNFGNFSDFTNFGHFWILAVIQNIWDLHKFGLQIWIQNLQKLPYERISGNFFDFIDFGHQVRVCKKRSFLNISCNSKKYGIYINLGCRFEFRTQKLPYERISGNFFDFIDFGHQVRVCKKRSHLNISCNSKNMGFT